MLEFGESGTFPSEPLKPLQTRHTHQTHTPDTRVWCVCLVCVSRRMSRRLSLVVDSSVADVARFPKFQHAVRRLCFVVVSRPQTGAAVGVGVFPRSRKKLQLLLRRLSGARNYDKTSTHETTTKHLRTACWNLWNLGLRAGATTNTHTPDTHTRHTHQTHTPDTCVWCVCLVCVCVCVCVVCVV